MNMASFRDPQSKGHQFLRARAMPGAVAWCRAALLVVGLTSCTHNLASIMQQWRNDDELAARVEDALLEARHLNLGHIDVDVESGVVYLIGEMDSSDSKAKAQDIVAKVPGVKKVVNKLEVEP